MVDQDLLGIMVWYASVKNGFDYTPNWDASTHDDSIAGYLAARAIMEEVVVEEEGVEEEAQVAVEVAVEEEAEEVAVEEEEVAVPRTIDWGLYIRPQ